ncbi:MAG: sigma-54-dependent Fis family transcriptional regulator [Gammaproteobacteria bacterium]|nr:sigma-54-dependent Fis family transcriptional regulator [Gammaproteobacteria bacterium]
MKRILIVDDEASICEALSEVVELAGYLPWIASSGHEALSAIETEQPALVFLDVQMPGVDGLTVLGEIRRRWPQAPVVMMTAYGTVQTALEAVRLGAYEYVGKPLEIDQVRSILERAAGTQRPRGTTPVPAKVPATVGTADALIGQSPEMQEVFKLMGLLTSNDLSVLISGESGVGKELVAKGIHANSARKDQPFVAVNCGAIPAQLLESELFGHERGAFTGATQRRLGRFETAAGGTLFLDEIGELDYHLQSKLLRVLQERRFERVGSSTSLPVDARILTATNRDLQHEVEQKRFREDLFHRINLVNLHVPPLRKRGQDLVLLANHFLGRANLELHRQVTSIHPVALERLSSYPWPGNVRELENTLRKAVLLSRGDQLTLHDLHLGDANNASAVGTPGSGSEEGAKQRLDSAVRELLRESGEEAPLFHRITGLVEQVLIDEALRLCDNNQVAASRLLGINRTTLRKKLP